MTKIEIPPFKGFPKDLLLFFQDLELNNSKDWFIENKDRYENSVILPAKSFIVDLGSKLKKKNPNMQAIPLKNKSIFKAYRDSRFAKGQPPIKTNLGMIFWEGTLKRNDNSGFYIHIDNNRILIGCGIYYFDKQTLDYYRDVIDLTDTAEKLEKEFKKLEKKGYGIYGKRYKRVPRDYDKDHKYGQLLKYSGICVFKEYPTKDFVKHIEKPEFLNFVYDHCKDWFTLHNILVEIAEEKIKF